jgi:hypothetical protein
MPRRSFDRRYHGETLSGDERLPSFNRNPRGRRSA